MTDDATKLIPSEPVTERQQGIEDGYQAAINDAEAGLLRGMGIYTTAQVMDFLTMYKTAIQQSIQNDIKGTYRLGDGSGHDLRLIEQILREADSKFSGLLKPKTNA